MNDGPDESTQAGQCPLCLSLVPMPAGPRATGDVLPILERHFAKACRALAFLPPWPLA